MKDAEAVLRNQLRLVTEGHFEMKAIVPDQTNTVSTSWENTSHAISTAYAFSVHSCVILDNLRKADVAIFWQENVVTGSTLFVGMFQAFTDISSSSLEENATVAYPVHPLLLECSEKASQISHRWWSYLGRVAICGNVWGKHRCWK